MIYIIQVLFRALTLKCLSDMALPRENAIKVKEGSAIKSLLSILIMLKDNLQAVEILAPSENLKLKHTQSNLQP